MDRRINSWVEGGRTACYEFAGVFEPGADWIYAAHCVLRKELGVKQFTNPGTVRKESRGLHGAVYCIDLNSEELMSPLEPEQAYRRFQNAELAMNSFPHQLGIKVMLI